MVGVMKSQSLGCVHRSSDVRVISVSVGSRLPQRWRFIGDLSIIVTDVFEEGLDVSMKACHDPCIKSGNRA